MFSLSEFHNNYETVAVPVVIDDLNLSIFKPATIDPFMNADNPIDNFPLWAKIWEASAMLASYLFNLPSDPPKSMLEIGCGLGVAGIAAAKAGHRVTMSEVNPDALNFARANAQLNQSEVDIECMDWNAPRLSGQYDYIVGSETVYKKEDIVGLQLFFDRYLKPDGTIILAERMQKTTAVFCERMQSGFKIQLQPKTHRAEDGTHHLVLFRLTRKGAR